MSVEAIIIEIFKEVNEPFYTKFIEPLRDNNNLTNVIGIFLFNNNDFNKERLTGFLKGVVQQLNAEQLGIFKKSMEKLKEKNDGVQFVKKDGNTNTVDPSNIYDKIPPFVLTDGGKLKSAEALKYIEINQIVLDREDQLENDLKAREENEREGQNMLSSLGNYVQINKRENAFLKLKKNIDKFSDELFPQLISDDEEGVSFLKEILDYKKYDKGMYDSIIKNIQEKFKSNEGARSKKVYREFTNLIEGYNLASSEDVEKMVEYLKTRPTLRRETAQTPIRQGQENSIKEIIRKANALLRETEGLELNLIASALARNKFGKRRRSYRKRKVTKKLENKDAFFEGDVGDSEAKSNKVASQEKGDPKKNIATDKKMKPCNPNSDKARDPAYECNPKTGRWVLRKGGKSRKKAASPPKRLSPSPARGLLTPIPLVERIASPRRSSPKKKSLRNRKKRDTRSDVIVVDIGDSQYEYNRADLIYDLEQGPVYFASYNAIAEKSERSIHLLAEKKSSIHLGAFYYALAGFDDESFHYVYNMFNRLMSVYRLYELPDEKDVYLTVNSLDLLKNTKYKEYELVKVGRTKELTKLLNQTEKELDIYDLLPIGYKGEIPQLVDTKRNKKAYFGTREITENLHELLKGFWDNTVDNSYNKYDDKMKISRLIKKYEFY